MQKRFTDPYELLEWLQQDSKVKISENTHTIFPQTVLYDVYLFDEQDYQESEHYRANLAKGLTLLQLLDAKGYVERTLWGLVGTYPLSEECYSGSKVSVFEQTLVDGEQVGVSYVKHVKAWLIGTRQNSLLAQKREDIERYSDKLTVQVSHLWFDYLDKLADYQRANLASDLVNRTLVGSLVGNPSRQLLVKHEYPHLVWFRLSDVAQVLTQLQFFRHYDLEAVSTYDLGHFATHAELESVLKKRLETVHAGDLEREGKGCVLYYEHDGKIVHAQKVLTHEYRIFKLLRDKLAQLEKVSDPGELRRVTSKFKKELKEAYAALPLPRHLTYYLDVGDKAFEFYDTLRKPYIISEQFLTFLSIVQYAIHNNQQPDHTMFRDPHKYLSIPWSTFRPSTLKRAQHTDAKKPKYLLAFLGLPGMGIEVFQAQLYQLTQKFTYIDDLSEISEDSQYYFLTQTLTPQQLESLKTEKDITTYCFLPDCSNTFNRQNVVLPFSFHFMLQCAKRAKESDLKMPYTKWFTYLKRFQNQQIQPDLEHLIKIKFTAEEKDEQYNETLENDFVDMVQDTKVDQECQYKTLIEDFEDSMKEVQLEEVQEEYFKGEIKEHLNHLIKQEDKQDKQKSSKIKKKAEEKKSAEFNPTYLPSYLAIFAENRNQTLRESNKLIKDCIKLSNQEEALYNFQNDSELKELRKEFQNQVYGLGERKYLLEKTLHVTTLYIGKKNEGVRQLPYFKQFQPQSYHSLYLKTLFLSPGNMIAGLIDNPNIPVQNPYPFILFYSKDLKAKDASDFISLSINCDVKVKDAFRKGHLQKESDEKYVFRVNPTVKNKKITVYIVSLEQGVQIDGIADAYYEK